MPRSSRSPISLKFLHLHKNMTSGYTSMVHVYGTQQLKQERRWKNSAGHSTPSRCVLAKDSVRPLPLSTFVLFSNCLTRSYIGAPMGSILVGSRAFIKTARHLRKLFGGGTRQIGFISACAAYSLTHHLPLLPSVHTLARRLADGLQRAGCNIMAPVETCMVFYDPSPLGLKYAEVVDRAAELERPLSISGSRLVVSLMPPHSGRCTVFLIKTGWDPRNRCISKPPQKRLTISSP